MNLFSTCLSLLPVDWQQHESFLFRIFILFIVFKIEIIKIFFRFDLPENSMHMEI